MSSFPKHCDNDKTDPCSFLDFWADEMVESYYDYQYDKYAPNHGPMGSSQNTLTKDKNFHDIQTF